jgi:hypothetical protein
MLFTRAAMASCAGSAAFDGGDNVSRVPLAAAHKAVDRCKKSRREQSRLFIFEMTSQRKKKEKGGQNDLHESF